MKNMNLLNPPSSFTFAVALLTTIFLGNDLAKAEPVAAKHLSKSEATKLFPGKVLDYKFKDLKIKKKSETRVEYSATYKTTKKGKKELKLVITDVLPVGDPSWFEQIVPSEEDTGGYPSKMHKDKDKHTLMVLVGKRFRVDFKSRQISPEKLIQMSKTFDFSPITKVAGVSQ